MANQIILSVILPCRNEEAGLRFCLPQIKQVINRMGIPAEIIVVDNGSTDKSTTMALENGVRVVTEPQLGYGVACRKGFSVASGRYFFLADADGSYDFAKIPDFLSTLEHGNDFVIGNRFQGKIDKGAMPWSHRYLGNPILSFILKLFFKSKIRDSHCGMRAISRSAYQKLALVTTGMEFASEMIVMAIKKHLQVAELPINYHKRQGISKLRRLHDGWRHLRFMLLYKPFVLFFIPGFLFFTLGALLFLLIYFTNISLFNLHFYYHPLFLAALLIIAGYQLIIFSLFAKTYAVIHLGDTPTLEKFYHYVNLERACLLGFCITALGGFFYLQIFMKWLSTNFGALSEIKNSILGLTLMALGVQTIFSAFMLSILGIKQR